MIFIWFASGHYFKCHAFSDETNVTTTTTTAATATVSVTDHKDVCIHLKNKVTAWFKIYAVMHSSVVY